MQTNLGPVCALYPMPTTLVGALVAGRPNFMEVAHVGILNNIAPQYLTVSLKKFRHTAKGIHHNGAFSICLPSRAQVVAADYCGIVSGAQTDKSNIFTVFYGDTQTAPLIEECPINMELRLHDVIDLPAHEVFVGELVATHADPAALDERGKVDLERVKPLLFDYTSGWYFSLGEPVAPCWRAGRDHPAYANPNQGA